MLPQRLFVLSFQKPSPKQFGSRSIEGLLLLNLLASLPNGLRCHRG